MKNGRKQVRFIDLLKVLHEYGKENFETHTFYKKKQGSGVKLEFYEKKKDAKRYKPAKSIVIHKRDKFTNRYICRVCRKLGINKREFFDMLNNV